MKLLSDSANHRCTFPIAVADKTDIERRNLFKHGHVLAFLKGMMEQKEPTLGDMLEYIEARNKALDEEGKELAAGTTDSDKFMSAIKFNGVPILPPVLTQNRREEMHSYKSHALQLESKKRARRREELHARVQSIVAGVEEKRAAKAAAKLASSSPHSSPSSAKSAKQPVQETLTKIASGAPVKETATKQVTGSPGVPSKETVTRLVTGSSTVNPLEGGRVPVSITISVPDNSVSEEPVKDSEIFKEALAVKTSPKASRSDHFVKSPEDSNVSIASTRSNLSYLKNMGKLSKQKSYSSQYLDRTPSYTNKMDSESSLSPDKKDSSPKSRALLPHPPSGRPSGRKSPLRQSSSTPDLRTIDFRVETDELRKPFPSRSRSPKGGRPQSGDMKTNEKKETKVDKGAREKKSSDRDRNSSEKERRTNDKIDPSKTTKTSAKENNRKEAEKSKDIRKVGKTESNRNIKSKSSKVDKSEPLIQNPLEKLEQELSLEDQREKASQERRKQTDGLRNKQEKLDKQEEKERAFLLKQRQDELAKDKIRTEMDPIEMAAAELQALNITEEQALATLDSLQSDFASLEQMDNLPQDYNGIPLTNKKQQQIIHMLTKLSKALNIEDTLTSTTSSNASGETNKDMHDNVKGEIHSDNKECVQNGASTRNLSQVVVGELGQDDSSLSITSGSNLTGTSHQGSNFSSASSNHSRARMSPTGSSSILSSASSISGSRLRMSPKSLKNTVHFSSFVTEISTSASQSMEDKISVRKLDITPVNSTNFDAMDGANSGENVSDSATASGSRLAQQQESLLSKVALSPSVDSSGGSPGEFYSGRSPFETSQDGELNTSDKENEFVPEPENSDDNYDRDIENRPSNRHSHVLNVYTANIPQGPIGSQHPAVVKSSVKSDGSDSTLKGSQDKLSSQENLPKYMSAVDQLYPESIDLGKPISKSGIDSSISSLQEEITRSYILSQHNQFGNKTAPIAQRNRKEELKRASMKGSLNQWEGSPIILKPVIYNRSLQQEIENETGEQKLLTGTKHLDKVELDVTEVDSNFSDEEDENTNALLQNQELIDIEPNDDCKNCVAESEQCDENTEEVTEDNENAELEQNNNGENEQNENSFEPVIPENILPETVKSTETEEEEGKAEHIQRYLSHVHEQSLQNEDEFKSIEDNELAVHGDPNLLHNISSSIQSFMSSLQGMNHLSHEELFQLQAKQFEILQQHLIEQQQAQLEELFVQQRREQLNLQKEIEDYQHKIQGQDEIETINLGESMKPSISQPQVSTVTAWPYQAPVQSSAMPIHSQMNFDPDISRISHNTSLSTIPFVPPAGDFYGNQMPVGLPLSNQLPQSQFHGNQLSRGQHPSNQLLENQPRVPVKQPMNNQNQYSYIPSPSISRNPKDFDNTSDVSSILLKGSPKQLMFSNQSTPVRKEPKVYKPVLRSPMKPAPVQRQTARVNIPKEVHDPAMQQKFARVSAAVKGYLTRQLLKTQKVQEILKTIKDTRNFAFSFQAETPIKKGTFSREDRTLLERIIAQLQAALLDIHEIFFIIPVDERMALISHSRQLEEERKLRESQRSSVESVSRSQHRLSSATLKALERKKKAQLAEEAVFGSCEFRPKSAPPATSSPAVDISGPIRRHFQSLFDRALKPLQGHVSPIKPDGQVTVREFKERPKSAPNKGKKDSAGNKNRKTASGQTSNKTGKNSGQAVTKTKAAPSKTTKKPEKAWR